MEGRGGKLEGRVAGGLRGGGGSWLLGGGGLKFCGEV